MKTKILMCTLCATFAVAEAEVQNSILSNMERVMVLDGKVNTDQASAIEEVSSELDGTLRVMSFNMLLNEAWSEKGLDRENRWPQRAPRVIEYLNEAVPDLIGSQELQKDQIDTVMGAIGADYSYYGIASGAGEKGDIAAVFYRKDRLQLVEGQTYYFSENRSAPSKGPFRSRNTFVVCRFVDMKTGKEFMVINTHFSFGNIDRRLYEARILRDFVQNLDASLPLVVTGDFNTFPFRPDIDAPFYDGAAIMRTIREAGLEDGMEVSLIGHFGPISSTNYSPEKKKSFESLGTPGVIVDHIFVNKNVKVIRHGIDPAKVDGHFPSDHFPIIADVLLSACN